MPLVLEYLRLMPPALERVFREKCVGLYFVENLQGNGVKQILFGFARNPTFIQLQGNLSIDFTNQVDLCP